MISVCVAFVNLITHKACVLNIIVFIYLFLLCFH